MFELLKLRKRHGYQAVPNIRSAKIAAPFRGFPILNSRLCPDHCQNCVDICPTGALTHHPLSLDMGRCTFCGECSRICPAKAIQFSTTNRLGSTDRNALIIHDGQSPESWEKQAISCRIKVTRLFSRSLRLRQVSAAGCNGCEMELNACNNVNFDMGRFGLDFVASPRHADGIVVTGPVSRNMAPALLDAYHSVAEPRLLILVGACAISGGLFAGSSKIDRSGLETLSVDLYVPGCPTHPLTFINSLLDLIGRK